VNILGYFKGLKPGESGEKILYYENEGEYKPPRFRVVRKTREAEEKGLEALMKTRMRKKGGQRIEQGANSICNSRYVNN
jgi:hypothetical protein